MTRKEALDAMTAGMPASRRIAARRDALRTLMYAEGSKTGATGQGYAVAFKGGSYAIAPLGKESK